MTTSRKSTLHDARVHSCLVKSPTPPLSLFHGSKLNKTQLKCWFDSLCVQMRGLVVISIVLSFVLQTEWFQAESRLFVKATSSSSQGGNCQSVILKGDQHISLLPQASIYRYDKTSRLGQWDFYLHFIFHMGFYTMLLLVSGIPGRKV